MSNWREILRAQEDDLKRMEEMDAALNEDQEDLDLNIKAILRVGNSRTAAASKGNGSQRNSTVSDEMRFETSSERTRSSQHREVSRFSSQDNNRNNDEKFGAVREDHRHHRPQLQHEEEEFRGSDDEEEREENFLISKSEKSILSPSMKQQAPDTTARSSSLISLALSSL